MKSETIDLTRGSIVSGIIRFSVPILFTNLLQQLYNSVDSAVVGHYCGSTALAAVGAMGALINLLTGFFLGVATGTGILFAMHCGAGNIPGLKKLVDSSMLLAALIGIILTASGVVFTEELVSVMNTPDSTFAPSVTYLRIYMTGTLATMIYNVGAGLIRSEGDSLRPLIYLIIGGAVNIVLDFLSVAVFNMGIAGTAYATVAAQSITALLILLHLRKLDPGYALRILNMKPDKLMLWDIVRISIPCGIQAAMFNISNFLVQIKINSFGAAAMAGITAYSKLDTFSYMPMNALALAVSTFVGQNIGAGRYGRMRKGIITVLTASLLCSVTICLVIAVFFDPLIHLFTVDPEAISFGKGMSVYLLPTIWIYSFVDIIGGAVRGSGQATQITVITALTICLFRVLWLEITLHFSKNIVFVYLCYPISWLLCMTVTMWYYYRRSSLHKNIIGCKLET